MAVLSLDHDRCQRAYDAVVVGSGYGGGVAACRLAAAGWSVCVLERGRELQPGDYPSSTRRAIGEVQAHTRRLDLGSSTGMFDFRLGRGMSALVGCGLGGTSLINANVMLRTPPSNFDDERWPEPLRSGHALDGAYTAAETMLGARVAPSEPAVAKLQALQHAASVLGYATRPTPIAVAFADVPATAGGRISPLPPCTSCGNCVSGCNDGAKSTVLMNYLPTAVAAGAQLFTELRVDRVTPGASRRWRVHARPAGQRGADRTVEADVVVLAAGALGSTEIVTRSVLGGLPASREIGRRFSGNGDYLGVAYDSNLTVRAMGRPDGETEPLVGPCISGTIVVPGERPEDETIVQDGVIPAPLAPFLPAALLASTVFGRPGGGRRDGLARWLRRLADVARGPYRGATERTLTFLLMTNDEDDGSLTLDRDRLAISWPGASQRPSARRSDQILRQLAEDGLDATYLAAPWARLSRSLLTVHPLGGCIMGERAESAVVDDLGRVFAGPEGREVHPGLHVLDGAIVPRPLGVNPSLTIAALAERASEAIVADGHMTRRGRAPADRAPRAAAGRVPAGGTVLPAVPPPSEAPGIRWQERLAGPIEWRAGADRRAELDLRLTIEFDDFEALRGDVTTPARITGQVVLPPVSDRPLDITAGLFQMFITDGDRVDTQRMTYRIEARAADGQQLRIDGHKVMHDDGGFDAWRDLTTLVVTVRTADGELVGTGDVTISVTGVASLAASITPVGAPSAREATRMRVEFVRLFLGKVTVRYGKALATVAEFQVPPRAVSGARRLLPPPEVAWFVDGHRWVDEEPAPDGPYASLKLTRFTGRGSKGPVMLAPGFAMAARSFALETTEQNLAEHLWLAGYDVWLFDYRAGIELPSARSRFTIDDVVRQDWPTAIAEVRARTGAEAVQVVGHCMGSTTALMALASGVEGLGSVVCSQNTLHLHMLPFSRFKARSRLAHLLQGAGFERISEPVLGGPPGPSSLALDLVYRLNPLRRGERCSSPMCRWAFAYFGPTHRHDRLNEETHRALRTEFGPASLDAMAHIAAMARRREAVTVDGRPYFNASRMRVPVLFLAGEHNRIFLPSGARRTYALLREANPDVPYEFQLLKRYGHLDGLVGRNAHRDVFPFISAHLDRHGGAS